MDLMTFLTILISIIAILSFILSLLQSAFPAKIKPLLNRFARFIKNIFNLVFQIKNIPNFFLMFFGAILILIVFLNNESTSFSDDNDKNILGSSSLCNPNDCYFSLNSGNSIYFPLFLKYDSINTINFSYRSDTNQILRVGVGSRGIYNEFPIEIDETNNKFIEINLFSNYGDSSLCSECFNRIWRKIFGSLGIKYYIKITSEDNLYINYLKFNSVGSFNLYRIFLILVGILYIIVSIIGFKLINRKMMKE